MPFLPIAGAWLMLAVAIFVASDFGQKFLYDGVVPGLWWRAAVAALPMAALIYFAPVKLDEMFTGGIGWTLLHCVLWFLLLWLLCGYMREHAALAGPIGFLLLGWAASLLIDNLSRRRLPIGMTGS